MTVDSRVAELLRQTNEILADPVALGRYLYETQENRCVPPWDQLDGGGATQSFWIERARARLFGDLA